MTKVFNKKHIKTIKWYDYLFLWLLPTYSSYEFGSTHDTIVYFKKYKGKIYIVDSETK